MTTKDFEIIDQVANEISPEYKATLSIEEEWVSFENTKNAIISIKMVSCRKQVSHMKKDICIIMIIIKL